MDEIVLSSPTEPQPSALRVLPWLLGSLPAVLMAWRDWRLLDGLTIDHAVVWGRDFANLWTGGRLALRGELGTLYPLQPYGAFQETLFGPLSPHNYSYPPSSLFLALPFAALPYGTALAVWLVGTAACFLVATRAYTRDVTGFPSVLAILTPAATICVWSGQYGLFVGALWLATFAATERTPAKAGFFAALLTVKPHLGVLLPFLLLWRHGWRAMIWATLLSSMLLVASGFAFGFPLWRSFLHDAGTLQIALLRERGDFFLNMMPSTYVAARQLGVSDYWAWAFQLAVAGWAILTCRRVARSSADWRDLGLVAATATFLVLPYAFDYDMTAADFGIALMLHRHWPALASRDRALLIIGFVSPQLIILTGSLGLPFGSLLLAGALSVQARIACDHAAPPRPYSASRRPSSRSRSALSLMKPAASRWS